MNSRIRRVVIGAACALAVLAPFFVMCALIVAHGVNVPFMDEWESVRLFEKMDAGTLSIADIWQQHNEHRIFFVNLITVGVGGLTHWNLGVQMMISLLLALGTLLVFCAYVQDDVRRRPVQLICLVLVSALLFSAVQWENFLRAFQLQWFLCIFAGVAALYLLDARAKIGSYNLRFCLAIALCFVSAYSLGSGIFFWAAGLVPLIATKQSRRRIGVWAGAAGASLALYFYQYMFLEKTATGASPVHYVEFFLAYIGNVFTYIPEVAVIFGAVILGVSGLLLWYALRVRRIGLSKLALPIGLMIFVLLSDLVTTQSRVNVTGAFGATTSKYATVSTLLVVALILICMQLYRTKQAFMPLLLSVVMVPLIVGVSLHGVAQMRSLHDSLAAMRYCLGETNPSQACLGSSHPSPGKVAEHLPFLKREHLGGF